MTEEIKVKNYWWDESMTDFHVITEEGKHLIFKNAYLNKIDRKEDSEVVKISTTLLSLPVE